MNKVTLPRLRRRVLRELATPYTEATAGLFVADGPHVCSKLIAAACDGGVKVANMTIFDDVVLREGKQSPRAPLSTGHRLPRFPERSHA